MGILTTPNVEIILSFLKHLVIFILISVTYCCWLNGVPPPPKRFVEVLISTT